MATSGGSDNTPNNTGAGAGGFTDLWPTTLLQRQIPGAEAANAALLSLIDSLERQHRQQQHEQPGNTGASAPGHSAPARDFTSDYLATDFLARDEPVIGWLKQCINKTVADYLRRQGIDYTVDWGLQGWPNVNRRGDYHNLHNHPHSYLSGTYYVQMPSAAATDTPGRQDLNPSAISFFDPRGAANMTAIAGDAQVDPEHRVVPLAGTLLLWPAFLHHLVHPNLSDTHRVSISFNVVLRWRDEYVPSG